MGRQRDLQKAQLLFDAAERLIPRHVDKIRHKLRLRMQADLVRRPGLFDPPLVCDDYGIRDFHRLLLVVCHKDAGDAHPADHLRVLNTYVISKFYRILYLSQSRLIFLSNFEIYLLYGDVRC